MTFLKSLPSLVNALDHRVGQAWAYTEGDLQRECAERRGWRRGATYVRYVMAFATLIAVAVWRHETQRAGSGLWGDAARHTCRVWTQGLLPMLLVAGVLGYTRGDYGYAAGLALGCAYGVTMAGPASVGLSLQVWFPSGKMSNPIPLPLRLRAAAMMAFIVLLMMGQLLPLAGRLLTDTWTYAPIGLDTFQPTVVENLLLAVTFALQGDLGLVGIVLPALTLPFVFGAVTLCMPLAAHGFEYRRPPPDARTGMGMGLLMSAQMLALCVVGFLTYAARWPVAALIGQCLLLTVAAAAAMRGLTAAAAAARGEVT